MVSSNMDKIFINCKYRDEIIVPLVCISPNVELLCVPDKGKVGILCLMKDGILAKIRGFEMKTIFEFEEDIKRLYKVEPYEWLKKWYNACEGMLSNLYLCHIYLTQHKREE